MISLAGVLPFASESGSSPMRAIVAVVVDVVVLVAVGAESCGARVHPLHLLGGC